MSNEDREAEPRWEQMKADAVAAREWSHVLAYENRGMRFPRLLDVWYLYGLTDAELREALADWPDFESLWPHRWDAVYLFKKVGYVGDLPRPTEPLTLYRGVRSTAHRRGLSWTVNIETARFFADRYRRDWGFVYRVTAPPEAILAGFGDREEAEYVLDPVLLPRLRRFETLPPHRLELD